MPNYNSETHKWPVPDTYTANGLPVFVCKMVGPTPEQIAESALWQDEPVPNFKGQLLKHRTTHHGARLVFRRRKGSGTCQVVLSGGNRYSPFVGYGKTPEDALADLLVSLERNWGDP